MTTNVVKIGKIQSLTAAAQALQCSPDTIIEHAASGAIWLFVSIPDDVVVVSTNRDYLKFNDPATDRLEKVRLRSSVEGRKLKPMAGLKFLELSHSDCSSIANLGEHRQSVYSRGLKQFPHSPEWEVAIPETMTKALFGSTDLGIGRLFACYSFQEMRNESAAPVSLKNLQLDISSLRICERDLDVLRRRLEAVSSPTKTPFDDGFVEKEYMSQRLLVLHQAAITFWNPNTPVPGEAENEKVSEWIQKEYEARTQKKFGKTLASQSIQILRESYQDWDQEKHNKKEKLTPFINLVEVGEIWANGYKGPKDLHSAQIINDLIALGFPEYLAKHGSKILRPEAVQAGNGQRKKEINE